MGSASNSLGDTITSTTSFTRTTVPKMRSQLSASGLSKIERHIHQSDIVLENPSKYVVVTKWVATIIFGVLLLVCLVSSKLSAIGIAAKLSETGNCFTNQNGENSKDCSTSFILLLLLLVIPNVLTCLRFTWNSLYRKDRKWPSKLKIFYCVCLSLIESFGMCLFAFKVLKINKSATVVLLMDGVFIGHSIVTGFINSRSRNGQSQPIKFAVSTIMIVAGCVLTIFVIADRKLMETKDLWHIFVSILCLSTAWLPWVRKKIVSVDQPIAAFHTERAYQATESRSSDEQSQGSSMYGGSSLTSSQQTDDGIIESKEKYTHKLMIISSGTKTISTFLFAFLIQSMFDGWSVKEWSEGWDLRLGDLETTNGRQTYFFMINIITSILGYAVGLYVLRTQMGKGGFAVPLLLSTPVTFGMLYINDLCSGLYFGKTDIEYSNNICHNGTENLEFLLPALLLVCIGQCLSIGYYVYKSSTIVLQKEVKLFWMPMYNSFLPDQWMLLDRRTQLMDDTQEQQEEQIKKTKVYICTTMYRETRDEMKQLLESISLINAAKQYGTRHFESHIIFDGGIKGNVIGDKALQLLSLVPEVLKTGDVDTCTKADFPYGLRLSWRLPASKGEGCGQPMTFVIHLKDNRKVKNKKRWSQIMYMSYILDFLVKEDTNVDDETAFILTTDADVKFTPDSVEALLDLMTRDTSVGAVCARTHPLGEGPLYWYQQFEYAIGHWFQKAAEHVLGSVLCAPGCFSVYRVRALRDIIPTYASNVEKGLEFLTKDMGEDRWLCTLMVQSGWRIDYCAASCNYTNCPTEFDEFYTQRRRWIGSTIANLYLLLKEAKIVRKLNQGISIWFLVYQAALLVSTVLGPSTVMLIISGGLAYAWGLEVITTVIVQFILIVLYGIICIKTSQKTQLLTAKILTFAYALVMMAVVVGTAEQIVENLANINNKPYQDGNDTVNPTFSPDAISKDFPISITTVYFGCLVGLFFVTGLCHLDEFTCLFQGLWFLLCLPSGYIMLIIYSVVNITDRSWGTREEKQENTMKKASSWYEYLGAILRQIFFCCDKRHDQHDSKPPTNIETSDIPYVGRKRVSSEASDIEGSFTRSWQGRPSGTIYEHQESREDHLNQDDPYIKYGDEDEIIKVEDWFQQIDPGLKTEYVALFKKHGYDDTSFIASMTETDLKRIGIKKKTQRTMLENRIKDLPDFLIEAAVPDNVDTWLKDIGLHQYKSAFTKCHIKKTKDLEQLKTFEKKDIENELGITKAAHVRRLQEAIKYLRTPTKEELLHAEIKQRLDNAIKHDIQKINSTEYEFWKLLTDTHLKPTSEAFSLLGQLKIKLEELRNTWLMILLTVNSLWLMLISTLASKINLLVLGSLVFLLIFGVLLLVQFFCMLFHRLSTLAHFLARAPYRFGHGYRSSWSYKNDEDIAAVAAAKRAEKECRQRERNRVRSRQRVTRNPEDERSPLIKFEAV
ncbi:CHS1 [Mytilus edulis]|uniref:chitin synthase n=1 Tax=Mytilus edulis TaxID=6550 RepID=A0A8S3UG31_MYTED|nr:CHS1 [Mytilus edulis]